MSASPYLSHLPHQLMRVAEHPATPAETQTRIVDNTVGAMLGAAAMGEFAGIAYVGNDTHPVWGGLFGALAIGAGVVSVYRYAVACNIASKLPASR
jgi:hypothetical protein